MCFVNWPEIDKKQDFLSLKLTRELLNVNNVTVIFIVLVNVNIELVHKRRQRGQGIDFVFDPGLDI